MSEGHYKVVDDLSIFEFHDSFLELDYIDGDEIAVYADMLNIHKDAEQNPKGYDLEIKKAHIKYCGTYDCSYSPGREYKKDEQGNWMPIGKEIVYQAEEAMTRITEELQHGINVFDHTTEDGYIQIEGDGIEPFFTIKFKIQNVVIEWDEYLKPAWYELTKQFKRTVLIQTPKGETEEELHFVIHYDLNDVSGEDHVEDTDPILFSIGTRFEGKEYWGRGKNDSGIEAFANLQKQLPEGVELKFCLSCRYGNQCPFSNNFDFLYCMKDVIVKDKMDIVSHIEDAVEEARRSRCATDVCSDWERQCDDYYVYSDYPYYFK